jgi:hypothetical protein
VSHSSRKMAFISGLPRSVKAGVKMSHFVGIRTRTPIKN